jgi:hypothetical protein
VLRNVNTDGFDSLGFDSLELEYAGGRPPKSTSP